MLRIRQIESKNSLLRDESRNNTSKQMKKNLGNIHVCHPAISKFNTYYLEIEISSVRRRGGGRESGGPSIADKLVENSAKYENCGKIDSLFRVEGRGAKNYNGTMSGERRCCDEARDSRRAFIIPLNDASNAIRVEITRTRPGASHFP